MRPYVWNPWRTAEATPVRPAVSIDDHSYSFADVTGLADRLERGIRATGIQDGSVLATDLPIGPELFALILAALRGGYGVFPVSHDWGEHTRRTLLGRAGAVLDVTEPATGASSVPRCRVHELAGAAAGRAGSTPAGGGPPAAGFLVFMTCGTTGTAWEPVVVARRRPWYSYRGVAVMPRYGAGIDRGPHLMANPAYHFGTLGPALYALQAGSEVIVQSRWSTTGFREIVDRHQVDSALVAPIQLDDLVEAGRAPAHPMRAVLHGGPPITPEVKRAAIGLFGPVVHEYYGTATGIISEASAGEWLGRPGTVGRPLPGVRVAIAGEYGPAAAGQVGPVVVRYRPIDSGSRHGPYQETGDLGYVDDAGYLFITRPRESNREPPARDLMHNDGSPEWLGTRRETNYAHRIP